MPQQTEEDYILTEEEIATLFDESMRKYKNVKGRCNPIYQHLIDELRIDNEAKELFKHTSKRIIHEKQSQKENVLSNELERVGFQIADPYYLACMKPIAPLIYEAFFKKGQTSHDIKQRFEIRGINQGFEEMGGNSHHRFKRKFYSEGKKYYKRLKAKGILKKFPDRGVPSGQVSNNQLSQSWITDYLDKMRSTAKDMDYMHLIEAR